MAASIEVGLIFERKLYDRMTFESGGYREGGAADAAQNIYGECRQAGENGLRISDLGLREGVPLRRHEFLWEMYTGEEK